MVGVVVVVVVVVMFVLAVTSSNYRQTERQRDRRANSGYGRLWASVAPLTALTPMLAAEAASW